MAWHKITHNATNEIRYVAALDGIDEELWEALPIVEDRCPDQLKFEIVDGQGSIIIDIAALKADLRAKVNALKDAKQSGPANTPFGLVDNDDEKSKGRLNGAATMALIAKTTGQPFAVNWTMHDNSIQPLDADQMIVMGVAAGQYVAQVQDYAGQLKAQIEAVTDGDNATTVAALKAIDITSGWPATTSGS